MKTPKNLDWLKRVLMIVLFVCLLPLAPELLIIMDVVGIEATLLFLFLYSNQLLREFTDRLSFAYYVAEARVHSKRPYARVGMLGFGASVVASVATLLVTGSLTLALLTWSPVLMAQI